MKTLFSALLILAVISTVNGQAKEIVENNIYKIKSIPYNYSRKLKISNFKIADSLINDSAYLKILKLDTFAIPFLIPYMADTSQTDINNVCNEAKFKIADLAFLLINDIEFIPYGSVMHVQVCSLITCDSLCWTYMKYYEIHKDDRLNFKNKYSAYYYSSTRQERLEWWRRREEEREKEKGKN